MSDIRKASLFDYPEVFVGSIDKKVLTEIGKEVFLDEKGKLYLLSFGGEKYVIIENYDTYYKYTKKKRKGIKMIIFFSMDGIDSSFQLWNKDELQEVLKTVVIVSEIKKITSVESLYSLSSGDLLFMNSESLDGSLYKNMEEFNLLR